MIRARRDGGPAAQRQAARRPPGVPPRRRGAPCPTPRHGCGARGSAARARRACTAASCQGRRAGRRRRPPAGCRGTARPPGWRARPGAAAARCLHAPRRLSTGGRRSGVSASARFRSSGAAAAPHFNAPAPARPACDPWHSVARSSAGTYSTPQAVLARRGAHDRDAPAEAAASPRAMTAAAGAGSTSVGSAAASARRSLAAASAPARSRAARSTARMPMVRASARALTWRRAQAAGAMRLAGGRRAHACPLGRTTASRGAVPCAAAQPRGPGVRRGPHQPVLEVGDGALLDGAAQLGRAAAQQRRQVAQRARLPARVRPQARRAQARARAAAAQARSAHGRGRAGDGRGVRGARLWPACGAAPSLQRQAGAQPW